ncbi:MAG: deoxyhypusine synthase family protein [Nanoarchaeota archaeon]|nr:deoxyhypusine synthase family protein [Nanoarchaeota archaeon]
MKYTKDFSWKQGMNVNDFLSQLGDVGFQSVELKAASDLIIKMKQSGAKIYMTFTSNMVTSGLRGLFAQLIKLGMIDIIVTTAGAIEEDFMKALGEKFELGSFYADDVSLHERGENRVGNLVIRNESYMKFEDKLTPLIQIIYDKQKRLPVSEFLEELGNAIDDKSSILYQAAKNKIPIFCPGITDGAIGFHLFMFQQSHKDFVIDVVQDFKNIIFCSNHDEKKGIIALGGSISKHHAILSGLLNGGFEYALYMTTAHQSSGSMSGATTQEAKSWGKIKDDADAVTVIGDVSINFPLAICRSLDILNERGVLKNE